jgi:hypothetical protein
MKNLENISTNCSRTVHNYLLNLRRQHKILLIRLIIEKKIVLELDLKALGAFLDGKN